MAQQHIGQRLQLGAGISRTCGVRGAVENEPFGLRGDGRLKRLGCEFEIRFNRGRCNHRGAACKQNHIGVAHPIRGRDDHLIAGV